MSLYAIDTGGALHPGLEQEWLLTNGNGAFASSSVVGCNRRRYHGLLCAAMTPPLGRLMALARVGELVFLDGRKDQPHELSVNQFGNNFHPQGHRYLRRFELGATARWEYRVESLRVVKEVLLLWQRNIVAVRYRLDGDRPAELHLLPMVNLRDYHAVRAAAGVHFQTAVAARQASVTDAQHTLYFQSDAGEFVQAADWWYGQTYALETERGLEDSEDLFCPARLVAKAATQVTLWAGTEPLGLLDWEEELHRYDRRESESRTAGPKLSHAAADFIVQRPRADGSMGRSILAGYPWFADWGRDSMISLPGLLLATCGFDEAAQVLCLYAEHVSQGMIPNRFDDRTNEPHYNTVDASLWFIHAAHEYRRLGGAPAVFEKILRPACEAILQGYMHGTRYNIRMDESDGLVAAGDADTQLTWMDAKAGSTVFTPRHGKAVEINALWYNALMLMGRTELAAKVAASFTAQFYLNAFRGLADVIGPDGKKDTSLRPNQIIAVSLPHSPLNDEQQLAVVETVRRELLTPYGLRTLERSNPGYKGRYEGGIMERDAAYHNGTVWPWLIGPFLDAYLRVHRRSPAAVRQARLYLAPLLDHMDHQGCIGQISEIFDGDEPHRPAGCFAQAWSVAEVLRLHVQLHGENSPDA